MDVTTNAILDLEAERVRPQGKAGHMMKKIKALDAKIKI